jgi:hypothetical protein
VHTSRACIKTSIVACLLAAVPAHSADTTTVVPADWETKTASCPAKVTQSTTVTIRVTNVNDLLIDFKTGETAQYTLGAKASPISAAPPENPFLQSALQVQGTPCQGLQDALANLKTNAETNPLINPAAGARSISWHETEGAARATSGFSNIETAITLANSGDPAYQQCKDFITQYGPDPAVLWVKRVDAALATTSSGAPAHSVDFNVNLEPNQNYEFKLQEYWKGKVTKGGTMSWSCGENDIVNLSAGPLITTLPYRTYVEQLVPTATGTQNELVVNGNTPVNVLGAALINIYPPFPKPNWATGFAFSVGPVYTLGDAPSVSKLGLFVGGSFHLYRSFFLTPGIHIGQFADYPAGFHQGSVIPSGFGGLTPVTRNTAHFAIGITFKTVSFKKSSQNTGAAPNAGSNTPAPTKQPGSSNQQQGQQGSQGGGGGSNQAKPAPVNPGTPPPATQPASPSPPASNSK